MDGKVPRQETAPQKCAPNGYWIPSGSIESVNDAYHCCENFVQSVGYDYFFFVMYVPLTPRRKVEIVSTNYPLEWRRRYEARGYMAIDPIARAVVTWSRPFTWRSVQTGCDEKAQAFWEDARQHGLHDGLVVPLRCAAGGRAYLVMAGQSIPEDLAAVKMHLGAAMGFLSELGEQVFERLIVERWRKRRGASTLLTPRQTEVLQRLAHGMTVKEVARQLHISPRAVQHAMERVLVRLGATNTLEAKFSAWTLGLIEPGFEIVDISDIKRVSMLDR